jgi:hypothetical protein
MPLKEGLLLTTRYWDNYNTTFPGWKKIELRDPTYSGTKWGNPNGQRWLLPNLNVPPQLNQYLEDYCKDWIGNYTETYFEVNVLMIDEKNMLCMGTHDEVFRDLEKEGINCHVIPFRTRGFWDGGLHCITLDIRRQAVMKDYFFCRGNVGLKTFTDKVFPDVNIFLKKYNAWKNKKEK